MSRPRSSVSSKQQRSGPGRRVGRVLVLLATLTGCTTSQIDQIPHSIGGLPEGAPARPAAQMAYPAVHDMPPQRAQPLLDEEEQKRLEKDLTKVRNRQAPSSDKAAAKPGAQNTGQSKNP